MKDKLVMSPNNAEVCIAVPLFRHNALEATLGYTLALVEMKPLAYVLDMGDTCSVVGSEWVEKNLIFLGDL